MPTEAYIVESRNKQGVLITRSCATLSHEPCQDGNVAALSGIKRVPQGCFVVATYLGAVSAVYVNVGCTVFAFFMPVLQVRAFFCTSCVCSL